MLIITKKPFITNYQSRITTHEVMSKIHKTAIISPKAEIHPTVEIGQNVFIDDNVKIVTVYTDTGAA